MHIEIAKADYSSRDQLIRAVSFSTYFIHD